MSNNKNKSKALKKGSNNENGFFRALIFSFVTCTVTWIVLAFVAAFVMSKQTDSTTTGMILSPVIVALSLFVGGFVAGKINKPNAYFLAFVLGCAFLGMSYGISTALDLSRGMGVVLKTIVIVMMVVFPLFGVKAATLNKKKSVHRKRM